MSCSTSFLLPNTQFDQRECVLTDRSHGVVNDRLTWTRLHTAHANRIGRACQGKLHPEAGVDRQFRRYLITVGDILLMQESR